MKAETLGGLMYRVLELSTSIGPEQLRRAARPADRVKAEQSVVENPVSLKITFGGEKMKVS